MNNKIASILIEKTLAQLHNGRAPWRNPWTVGSTPHNAIRKNAYRGFNTLQLHMSAQLSGFTRPEWLTFRQAQSHDATIRKGEHATPIVFYKFLEKIDTATNKKTIIPMMRYYKVFNIEQLSSLGRIKPTDIETTPIAQLPCAETIVTSYDQPPSITHDVHGRAYYMPAFDAIHMSPMEEHKSQLEYYSTLFHELIHSTGHKTRLDRLSTTFRHGDHDYSKEELVAEIGATMLCSHCDIQPDIDNSAAYCASWARKLTEQPSMLISAAGQAQHAIDRILGTNTETEKEPTE